MPTTLGIKSRLRRARAHNPDMTLEAMSEVTGVSPRTLRRYEDDSSPALPSLLTAAKICSHFGYSIDQVAYGGGLLDDSDIENKWGRTVSWWTAHFSDEQKQLLMSLCEMVWTEAAVSAITNTDLSHDAETQVI